MTDQSAASSEPRKPTRGAWAFFGVVVIATAIGFAFVFGYVAHQGGSTQTTQDWVDNAPVVERGLNDLYVEEIIVVRAGRSSGGRGGGYRIEVIRAAGAEVDCKVFDDDTLDLRCKTDDGILPLTPEPQP